MGMTVSKLKKVVLLYGIVFIGFGIFQIIRAFNPFTDKDSHSGYNWKESRFLYKNVAIEESWYTDSVKSTFTSELCFNHQSYNSRSGSTQIRLNLLDPKFKHLPKIFGLYYLLISCLWGFVFYYFRSLVITFYDDRVFNIKNPEILKKLGKMLIAIGLTKYFSMLIIPLLINFLTGIYLDTSYDYDIIIDWFFLVILGNILLMFCNAFSKGITLEKEQELTI